MHRLIKKPSAKGEGKKGEEGEEPRGGKPRRAAFDFRLKLAGDLRRPETACLLHTGSLPSRLPRNLTARPLVNGVWRLKYNGEMCAARCSAAPGQGRAMHRRLFRRLGEIRYRHFSATPALKMRTASFSREGPFNGNADDSGAVHLPLLMNIYGGRIGGISRLALRPTR